MTNERDNLNHLRTNVSYKNPIPLIDSGFSSKIILEDSRGKHFSIILALQLAATTPLLPINSTQQSIEDSTVLRTLRMNALQVYVYLTQTTSGNKSWKICLGSIIYSR